MNNQELGGITTINMGSIQSADSGLEQIYKITNNFSKEYIFIYGSIVILIFSYVSRNDIPVKHIISLCMCVIVLFYMNGKIQNTNKSIDLLVNIKENNIYPPTTYLNKYTDIVDFIFSIQDFRSSNEKSYDAMIHELDNFFDIYEKLKYSVEYLKENYDLLNDRMDEIIYNLNSIKFNLPVNIYYDIRHKNAIDDLTTILNNYLQ